jgi:predicted metal-dependent hydrolase
LTLIGKREIILEGQTISYVIKRSARAKYVRLEVRPETGLTVVIPRSYGSGHVPDLLRAKGNWISSKLADYGHVQPLSAERELRSGDTIPYLGRYLKVVKRQDHRKADGVKLEKDRLVVSLKSEGSRSNSVLERWYRMQAGTLIKERVDKLSSRLGLTYNRLIIRGQKTRWASCSHKGNLSFNWRLVMVAKPVIDYVIIHELTHLKEMNHTKRFWKRVAEHCPRWREHRKWLKEHEADLAAKLSLQKQR